jgi:hypothetical protein
MRYGSYPEEAEDERQEFLRNRRYTQMLERNCAGYPICGCPICEPENEDESE